MSELIPVAIGDHMSVHRMVGVVTRLHPAGTVDVQCPDGNNYRVSGLWTDASGRPCRLKEVK